MAGPKTPLSQERILATDEFINRNNLRLKSQEEFAKKFSELQAKESFIDFRPEVLMDYLNFENARPFLKEEYIHKVEKGEEEWEMITTIEECAQDFLDYMNFAWGKAEDQRGISAGRSIQKLGMWLWIMNREDLQTLIEKDELYNPYGAPALIEVCTEMGITIPESLVEFAEQKC